MKKIAIIGGGISGLSVAYYLCQLKKKSGKDFSVSLFESSPRLGGVIETERRDGFLLEKGPDSFITDRPQAIGLSKALGLENEFLPTEALHRRSFVSRQGCLSPVPEGFYLIAPVNVTAFLLSPIFSWMGKARMMSEFLIPPKKEESDESVASFVRRRFGREALDRVGQAMIAGVYTGDPEKLSLGSTFGRFLDLEKKYGSVTRGLMAEARKKNGLAQASGPRYSLFMSYAKGMETLTEALWRSLPEDSVRTGCGLTALFYDKKNCAWKAVFSDGSHKNFDKVCLALSARQSAKLLKEGAPEVSENLSSFRYESVATINFAVSRDKISHALDGFGFVVPKTEHKATIACSFSSQKYRYRAPAGKVLLRVFAGGAFGRHHFEKSDSDLVSGVFSELRDFLGIRGDYDFSTIRRYPEAMIQYEVGHAEKVSALRKLLENHPDLFLTGSSYGGVGIPDCIREAEMEAGKMLGDL